jgi:hypothetical protein
MEVEPAVYYNGQVSDESEHWLDNQKPIALPSPLAINIRGHQSDADAITLLYGDQAAASESGHQIEVPDEVDDQAD